MKSQLYIDDWKRKYYKSTIEAFKKFFNDKLFSNFDNIEDDAEKFVQEYNNELSSMPSDGSIDMFDIAERVQDKGIIFYSELKLVKYQFEAISISSLYHIWEQQTRKYLYDEMRHVCKLNFSEFCKGGITDIKKLFSFHNLNLTKLQCWELIDELRLLCNVIKHGDGNSAKQLLKKNSNLFNRKNSDIDFNLPLDTTLLEETLNIDQELFNKYADNLIAFWDELPERSFSNELS